MNVDQLMREATRLPWRGSVSLGLSNITEAKNQKLAVHFANKTPALITAAKRVIRNWERGDLAAAVRDLDAALEQISEVKE